MFGSSDLSIGGRSRRRAGQRNAHTRLQQQQQQQQQQHALRTSSSKAPVATFSEFKPGSC
jgi:hypothetical protein